MEITEVNELIEELERCDTTYQNCNDLAGLYSVRDNLNAQKVEKEIDDILPAYRSYVEKKIKYQQGDTDKEGVVNALNLVCREIYDLIKMLFSSSDMPLERVKIQNLVSALDSEINSFK